MYNEPQKIIYFVRHGQSIDNASPVFQSEVTPLSDKGHRQADSIAERATKLDFDALIASPFPRAHQTAEHISRATGKPIELSDLFVERRKPAALNGKPWDDPVAAAMWKDWGKTLYTPGTSVEDGETYDAIVARADAALEYLLKRPEKHILVVTHGYFLRTMIVRVLLGDGLNGTNMKRFHERASIENTAISVLHFREAYDEPADWRLWTFNDHAHFAE